MEVKRLRFVVLGEELIRLDVALKEAVNGDPSSSLRLSRSQLVRLIKAGKVSVDGVVQVKPGLVVSPGSALECLLEDESQSSGKLPDLNGLEIPIVYEDDWLVVFDKPFNLIVHHGAGTSGMITLHDYLSVKYPTIGSSLELRGGIVHRLDKDTTGLIVVAKTLGALEGISQQFANRTVSKEYLALVVNTRRRRSVFSSADEGRIEYSISRDLKNRTKMTVDPNGRPAVTDWRIERRFEHAILVRCFPRTGRTHQIRVHCLAGGASIIGDDCYGLSISLPIAVQNQVKRFGRIALHASKLCFEHPYTGDKIALEVKVPADFGKLLEFFESQDSE